MSTAGEVRIDGLDQRRPVKQAFTWLWGDGTTTQGWFPQSHAYGRVVGQYVIKVVAHEDDGSTVEDQISIHF